jgi:hypothetical protein
VSDQSIVTVLGAGASARCGYPLAKDLFPKLEQFGSTLPENCKVIRAVIDHVISQAKELDCLTPDDLALQAHQRRGGGEHNYRAALRTLAYARIATDLFFLHLEKQVSAEAMERFKGYWHDALGGFTDNWFGRFPSTKQRLVSFNYDRIPELALARFFRAAAGQQHSMDIYSQDVLNTGLSYHGGCEFAKSRFCYLKLHGSIGIEPVSKNEIDADFGHPLRHYSPIGAPLDKLTDSFYFKEELDNSGLPVPRVMPLIAFPADKQRIEGGGSDYSFEKFINTIRPQAEEVFREASEIRIIGYSFAAPDKQWLVDIMRLAPPETEIIVHNPHASRLRKELTVYEHFKNVTSLDDYW